MSAVVTASAGSATDGPTADPLVPLGRTGWTLWPDAALRSAGFAADGLLAICDEVLAAAADASEDDEAAAARYATVYTDATTRLSAAVRRTAADDRFREAVTWQNPGLVPLCLDKAAAGEPRRVRGRGHELTIASYLQRYCLKNDSIGFFGPVGWASVGTQDIGLSLAPGLDLLGQRSTYLEDWAVDVLAEVIGARPEVWPWLRPRKVPYAGFAGSVMTLPFSRPVVLSAAEVRLLHRCDGRLPVRDLVGDPADLSTAAALLRLREVGAVDIDLGGPPGARPERALAARIATIDDPAVRARAGAPLQELLAARDQVAAAAGRPDQLARASGLLADTFERITGHRATRRAGQAYAGRTIAFEDTLRAVDVHIGRGLTDRLAAPLAPVLESAAWLVDTLAERYEVRAREAYERQRARSRRDAVPLHQLMAAVLPELAQPDQVTADSEIVGQVLADFQARWSRVLDLPDAWAPETRRHAVPTAVVAERAAAEFATGPPRWSGVRWHSPDLMVLAEDETALRAGDVEFVLGEVHCGVNTLESRYLVGQHPAVERLRSAAAASRLDGRVVFVPRRGSQRMEGRVSRADQLLLPAYTYVCAGSPALVPPPGATVLSLMDLTVRSRGEELVVRHRAGAEYPFLEVIGEPLSALFLSGFQPFRDTPHRPRILVGPLVLGRESWAFPTADLSWAFVADERRRYAAARRWRTACGLPERCFYRVPTERKPMAVDFRSLVLVNLFAKNVRRCAAAGAGPVTVTEMLPDLDRLWLTDGQGARYTAELRLVAVRGPSGPGPH